MPGATNNKLPVGHCMQVDAQKGTVGLTECVAADAKPTPNSPSQKWEVGANTDGTITIKQGGLCVGNNYRPWSPPSEE